MARCIELAKKGAGEVSPNPMVGCVIVYNNTIIGEGFHMKYGGAHAEVNAVNSLDNKQLLQECTLYVSLEPCAHYGLTPPCSDLIIEMKIPRVVIGTLDSNVKVAGKGIERMVRARIDVQVGILEKECRDLNRRFFTFHEKKRPYVFLKWAETVDGFIDYDRDKNQFGEPTWITGEEALVKVHQMRAEEDSILVGTNTAFKDNPSLTVRRCRGRNPIRLVIDNRLRLPGNLNLFDGVVKTIVLNSIKSEENGNIEFVKIDFNKKIVPQILKALFQRNMQSLIVEGGRHLLESFIEANLWDEVYRFKGNKYFHSGAPAPKISGPVFHSEYFGSDQLLIYRNHTQ